MISNALLHYYKRQRTHQMATYSYDAGDTNGTHAYAAYLGARRHIHFRKTLAADITAGKKRTAAAKRGWKTRRNT